MKSHSETWSEPRILHSLILAKVKRQCSDVFWRHCWVRWLRYRWIFQCSPVCTVPNGGSGEIPMLWRRASVSLRLRSKSESSGAASTFCCVSDCLRLQMHTHAHILRYSQDVLTTFVTSLIQILSHLFLLFFFLFSLFFLSDLSKALFLALKFGF